MPAPKPRTPRSAPAKTSRTPPRETASAFALVSLSVGADLSLPLLLYLRFAFVCLLWPPAPFFDETSERPASLHQWAEPLIRLKGRGIFSCVWRSWLVQEGLMVEYLSHSAPHCRIHKRRGKLNNVKTLDCGRTGVCGFFDTGWPILCCPA